MKNPFDFNNNGKLDIPELEFMTRLAYEARHRDDDNDDYVEEYDTYRKKPEERTFDLSDDDAAGHWGQAPGTKNKQILKYLYIVNRQSIKSSSKFPVFGKGIPYVCQDTISSF